MNEVNQFCEACFNGNLEKAMLLFSKKYCNERDDDGEPAIVKAARAGRVDVVRYLIKKRVKVDNTNQYHETALMLATKYGKIQIVKDLLNAGANTKLSNSFGETALTFAKQYSYNTELPALIINHKKKRFIFF